MQKNDTQLKNENFADTVEFSKTVFLIDKPIHKLLAVGFLVIKGKEWNIPLLNGIRSVRRGFYKIIGEPYEELINAIPTWKAKVLYCYGPEDDNYFEYTANVGPIINQNSVYFDASSGKMEAKSQKSIVSKEIFFKNLKNKVFYVSYSEYVDLVLKKGPKQTFWFIFNKN